jgi:hypothetical protein
MGFEAYSQASSMLVAFFLAFWHHSVLGSFLRSPPLSAPSGEPRPKPSWGVRHGPRFALFSSCVQKTGGSCGADSRFVDLGEHSLEDPKPVEASESAQQEPPPLSSTHPAVVLAVTGTTAVFKHCSFRNVRAESSAIILHRSGVVGVQVQMCTFRDNIVGRNFATWSSGVFFTDAYQEVLLLAEGNDAYTATKRAYSLEALSLHANFSFLSTGDADETFIRLFQVLPCQLLPPSTF